MTEENGSEAPSLEELMDYVETEAKKRVEEMSARYRRLSEGRPYDEVILEALREARQPMSADLLSYLTGINKSRCCKVLERLAVKWDLVRKVTVSRIAYYVAVQMPVDAVPRRPSTAASQGGVNTTKVESARSCQLDAGDSSDQSA